jgi:hypothetical protein
MIVLSNSAPRQSELATVQPLDDLVQTWHAAIKVAAANAGDPSPKLNVLVDEGDGGPGSHNPNFDLPPSQQQPPAVSPWWQDYGPQWTALTNGTSGNQNSEVQSLRAPLDALQALSDNWDRYDLGSIDWSNPPSDLPPDVANAIQLVEKNPALLKAITGGSGPVTKDELNKFIGHAQEDIDKAVKDYTAWQKANPDAGPMAIAMAQSAALLEANNTLLGGKYSAADLSNLASQNPGLSSSLTGAAAMWSQPGMLHQLDTAGQSLGVTGDGLVNGGNLINAAAARGATAGVDTSNLNADIFAHPQNYSGAQKAAALQQLMDAQGRLNQNSTYHITDTGTEEADGINPNLDKTDAELQSKINTLANDPDVRKFLQDNSPQSFSAIVNADPDMKAAINADYQKFQTGAMLNDDLNLKDSSGNQLSQPAAIHTFVSQAGFLELATGQNLDLTAIAKQSGGYNQILSYYNSNIVTAKDMDTAWTAGGSGTSAAQNFGAKLQDYGAVIAPSDGAPQSGTLQDNVNLTAFSHLTPEQLQAALGDGHGNLDETKVNNLIQQVEAANGTKFSDTDKEQIVGIVRNFWNAVIFSGQTMSAARDLGLTGLSNPVAKGVTKGFDIGVLHGASGILAGIATGLSAKQGPSDAAEITQTAGLGILSLGTLINSAGRIYQTNTSDPDSGSSSSSSSSSGPGEASSPTPSPEEQALTDAQNEKQTADENYDKAVGETSVAETKLDNAQKALLGALREEPSAAQELAMAETGKVDPSTIAQLKQKSEGVASRIDDLEGKYGDAKTEYQEAKTKETGALNAKTQAAENVALAQQRYDQSLAEPAPTEHSYPPSDHAPSHGGTAVPITKNRGPAAVGETTTGAGGIIGGAATIVIGQHDKAAGQVALGNINIASGALTLTAGAADLVSGGVNALSLGRQIIGGAQLGDWATLADGLLDTPLALGLLGLGIAGELLGLKHEKQQVVAETKSVDAALKQYGITGGATTPGDIQKTTPLAAGLGAPPNSNAPGNAPPSGPSQTHPD